MGTFEEMTLEYLADTPIGSKCLKALEILRKIQENAAAFAESDENKSLTAVKAGTMILFSILQKMAKGHKSDDFKDIAAAVSEYAVLMDGQKYSIFIFLLYAKYIEYSAEALKTIAPEEKCDMIKALAEEVKAKSQQLKNGEISESGYTEDCLWICLEAMVKLLSVYAGWKAGPENAELIEANAAYAFELARQKLYEKELELVSEYLDHQKVVDEDLQRKFDEYLSQLNAASEHFNALITDAFSSDFRMAFKSSVQLAEAAGVDKAEILDTQEKLDNYFMG